MRSAWHLVGLSLLALLGAACAAPARAERPRTYVALGASDAVGIGAPNPDTDGWVPQFAAHLGPNVRTINLGVSGSTLGQALDEQLGPALDAQPDIVTVWLAVNDLNARVPLDTYAAQLDSLLSQLDTTHATVLVGNVPDLGALAVYAGQDPTALSAEVDQWNAVIASATQRHGAILVDLFSHWQELAQHPDYVSSDGFHPSAEGYARLADVFAQALTDATTTPTSSDG